MSKTYDVHCVYEFVTRVEDVDNAQEAKRIAEGGRGSHTARRRRIGVGARRGARAGDHVTAPREDRATMRRHLLTVCTSTIRRTSATKPIPHADGSGCAECGTPVGGGMDGCSIQDDA